METERSETGAIRRSVTALAWATVVASTLGVAACGDSDTSTKAASATPAALHATEIKASGKAVDGFVSGLRTGDGAAACAFLSSEEKALFVSNANALDAPIRSKSCAGVVRSFHKSIGGKAERLDGSYQQAHIGGAFSSGYWVWSGGYGEQAVLIQKVGKEWLLVEGHNDFPSAVLHFFDDA
jgi:hypothetical protein